MRFVKVTKVEEFNLPAQKDIVTGYWLAGWLRAEPKVGQALRVVRTVRNGLVRDGIFETSPILDVHYVGTSATVRTANSLYIVNPAAPEDFHGNPED